MRTTIVLVALVTACEPTRTSSRAPVSPSPPPVAAPALNGVLANPTPPTTVPAALKPTAIDVTNLYEPFGVHHAIWIDAAGTAVANSHAGFGGGLESRVALPFTQPIDRVVFVRHVARKVAPGAQRGSMYCARTKTSQLECVTDYVTTQPDGRRSRDASYVFSALADGTVTHVATTPTREVCARIVRAGHPIGACWQPSPDGTTLHPLATDAATAIAFATTLPPDVAARWHQLDRDATVDRMHKIVVSRGDNAMRIVRAGTTSSWCAVLVDGALSCYGPGVFGELGDGKLDASPRAVRPLGATRVLDVSMHDDRICAVAADGRLACWGDVPEGVPLARGTTRMTLPMCPLDLTASRGAYDAAKQRIENDIKECTRRCDQNPVRDCHLNCAPRCNREPYIFDHAKLCHEPTESALQQATSRFADSCSRFDRTPHWLADADLRDAAGTIELVLAPAYVDKIKDATHVAFAGRGPCVLRRGGQVSCID